MSRARERGMVGHGAALLCTCSAPKSRRPPSILWHFLSRVFISRFAVQGSEFFSVYFYAIHVVLFCSPIKRGLGQRFSHDYHVY